MRLPDAFDVRALLARPRDFDVAASYERPDRDFALVGVGVAARVELAPGAAIGTLRARAREMLAAPLATQHPALTARLLGGVAFDPSAAPGGPWEGFAAGALILPRLLFIRDGGVSGVVLAPGVDPGEVERLSRAAAACAPPSAAGPLDVARDVDAAAWQHAVVEVAAGVRAGRYEKVVLAAARELTGAAAVEVGGALARLRAGYPHCHVFSVTCGDATFLGASPELLVGVSHRVVRAQGLAGSAPRGASAEADEELGRALLHSAKDRIEHEIVVRALREGLAPLTDDVRAPNQPGLLRLPNIQHLATEVRASARAGTDVLALVERLHPTPAVCGWPTADARRVIAEHERFDRGWYAGPVGWVDAAGDGEFAVALRSALVRGARAWLFAGAGIMGDSQPGDELAEIGLKFRPLTGALTGDES